MFYQILAAAGLIISVVELIYLILIYRDGQGMLKSSVEIEKWEAKTHELYQEWFAERRAERAARQESAKRARDAKAAKVPAQSVDPNPGDKPVAS